MVAAHRMTVLRSVAQYQTLLVRRGFHSSVTALQDEAPSNPSPPSTMGLASELRRQIDTNGRRTAESRPEGQQGRTQSRPEGQQARTQSRPEGQQARMQSRAEGQQGRSQSRPEGQQGRPQSRPEGQQGRPQGQQDRRGRGERGTDRTDGQQDRRGGARAGASRPQGQRRDGPSNNTGRPGSPRQGQGQREGGSRAGGPRAGREGGSPRARPQQTRVRRTRDDGPAAPPAPIQNIVPVTNWQAGSGPASQVYSRVPYATPRATIETLSLPKSDAKHDKPLHKAEIALRLHVQKGGRIALGPAEAPTLIARPGLSKGNALAVARSEKGGSIAAEAKEARVKYMQEKFGGDYRRWEAEELEGMSKERGAGAAQDSAVRALVDNDDLGPITKAWTLDAVKKIINGDKAQ